MGKFFTVGNELQGHPYFESDLEQEKVGLHQERLGWMCKIIFGFKAFNRWTRLSKNNK